MAITAKRKPMRRIAGQVPEEDAKALEQQAEENGRSIASELRLAVHHWLRANGRRG